MVLQIRGGGILRLKMLLAVIDPCQALQDNNSTICRDLRAPFEVYHAAMLHALNSYI